MMKHRTIVIVFSVVILVAVVIAAYMLVRPKHAPTAVTQVSYAGQLETIDVSAVAIDGPGVYTVRAGSELITVHLESGESACDRTAITVPNVKVGDTVSVRGDRDSDGIVRVCSSGTYITASE